MSRHTKKICFGPPGAETSVFWRVKVADAKTPVTINGSIWHALKGHAGMTIGCALSNTSLDKMNISAFPHPVFMASFTKSTALIVDKLANNGQPIHAIRYAHSYGHIIDQNDNRTLKRLVKIDPSIMERPFVLNPPQKRKKSSGSHHSSKPTSNRATPRSFVPRGALARAVKAGRIGKNVAEQLRNVASA